MVKLSKFLLICSLITFISCLYVYQQTEIFRLAYIGQKKLVQLEDLLDKNSILRYNINRNVSLVEIGSKVSEVADFQIPDSYRLVRLRNTGEAQGLGRQLSGREGILARLFGVRRQAEAGTINPSSKRPPKVSKRSE